MPIKEALVENGLKEVLVFLWETVIAIKSLSILLTAFLKLSQTNSYHF